MIVELPATTISQVAKELVRVREDGGVVALGRVLTLVIATRPEQLEASISAANDASREHPMRLIVVVADEQGEPGLDAQIRVGGDAGASEVIVLRASGPVAATPDSLITGLLLPDAPVVVWWPDTPPPRPADSSLGRIAARRITDASTKPYDTARLAAMSETYEPGDTDLAWTRLTHWREQLAAVLDQPPYEPITHVEVRGAVSSPSTGLLAAWLKLQLDVDVVWVYEAESEWSEGIKSVTLTRPSGEISLVRSQPGVAVLSQPGQPAHDLLLPRRSLRECLAEELRRLDPDLLYGRVITQGWAQLGDATQNESE